ncbi:protoporphyrinogen oxidase [Domibacillus mangrovi]|uniref:Coproporphyrinogen III oxidase n=1 Tax=Domibacillus mangrovi TaxID=1714354 RepID=A0A1Q5P047_9BACI|nr:protoporphyrinogen oxidase [Domibacillus mangrovi]OKL35635.1 protoporphyrinogen oxidase [Domibacillus mangrovi]
MKTAVIIGGGITGLSALYYLQKQQQNLHVILVEQNEELGGKIRTVNNDEFIMEAGADSIVARSEGVMPLIEELDLLNELVYNETGTSYIYTDNMLHKVPEDTIFGIPTSVDSLFSSTLISEKGKQEAMLDFEKTENPFTIDSSVGSFLTYFLGEEIVEKQISPILSGVYSGKLDTLTMKSTLPYLLDYKNKYGSIIKGFSENKKTFQSAGNKKFISFKNGLSTLIDRLEERSGHAEFLKGVRVIHIEKTDAGYELSFDNDKHIHADFVVLSTSHDAAQRMLNSPELDADFNELTNSSLTSVYIGFNISNERLPDGTGFIVTEGSDLMCDACTWTSQKWAHTSLHHHLLVRLFYKSSNPNYEALKQMNEEALTKAALSDIQKSLGLIEKPHSVNVTRWTNLMPNYHLQHSQAVSSLSQKMADLFPNVLLAGCSYYGVGIGACIANGKKIADTIADSGETNVN